MSNAETKERIRELLDDNEKGELAGLLVLAEDRITALSTEVEELKESAAIDKAIIAGQYKEVDWKTPVLKAYRERISTLEKVAPDYEAIAWAVSKLNAFGVIHSSMENALMVDRLEFMLQQAI